MANLNKIQRLTFIEDRGQDKNFNYLALYRCECGTEKVYQKKEVRNMRKTACGCQRSGEKSFTYKHGLIEHEMYNIWRGIRSRCNNPHNASYPDYGGRGISVCYEWSNAESFINWGVKNGYRKGLVLDRIKNDKNYTPDNCRFVTQKVNSNNKRNNRVLSLNGITKKAQQWADELGIQSTTLRRRIDKYKWPLERALTTRLIQP